MTTEQQSLLDEKARAAATSDAAARVAALRKEIEHHTYQYYALDDPQISDGAFDSLMRELRELEALPSRSPTTKACSCAPPRAATAPPART